MPEDGMGGPNQKKVTSKSGEHLCLPALPQPWEAALPPHVNHVMLGRAITYSGQLS